MLLINTRTVFIFFHEKTIIEELQKKDVRSQPLGLDTERLRITTKSPYEQIIDPNCSKGQGKGGETLMQN